MKNLKYIFLFISLFGLFSCEDVVDVDLPTAQPRLVVDASIDWLQGTDGSVQKIKLTTTTGFYSSDVPVVSNAVVSVENKDGATFHFIEEGTSGEYFCYDFVPEVGMEYTLTVIANEEVYTAVETMQNLPEFLYFTQSSDVGFGDDFIEIRYYFQDDPNEDNFYMDRIQEPNKTFPLYGTGNDKYNQGNEMYGLYLSEDIKQGDILNIKLYEISERYYDYMNKLLESVYNGGGPFQTSVGTVRGNLVNQTNSDNYALGYFRLCQVFEADYTVE